MARGVNKVILIGNLGKDPELRYTQGGTAVANFSLATSERVKRNGEWEDQTEWHNIVLWGKTAENAGEYLSKGSTIYVEGSLRTRKWKDRDGNDRYTTEIHAFTVQYLSKKEGGGSGKQNNNTGYGEPGGPSEPPEFSPDDDVPF